MQIRNPRHARWDALSESFATRSLSTETPDLLLDTITELGLLPHGASALDVGCGVGHHLVRLSSGLAAGIGLDSSPGMIRQAKDLSRQSGSTHLKFVLHDWTTGTPALIDGHRFDLVIAHKTPAVNGPADLDRLLACAGGACVVAKPVYRRSVLVDAVLAGSGRTQRTAAGSKSMRVLLGRAFELGYQPELRHAEETWTPRMNREQFIASLAEVRSAADPDFVTRAHRVFDECASEGFVEDTIEAHVTLAAWRVEN